MNCLIPHCGLVLNFLADYSLSELEEKSSVPLVRIQLALNFYMHSSLSYWSVFSLHSFD